MNTHQDFPSLWPAPRRLMIEEAEPVSYHPDTARRALPSEPLPREGFRVRHQPGSLLVECADDAAWRHAQATLRALSTHHRLPPFILEDWPEFPVRGVMLDISRCKVPRQDMLLRLVEVLSDLRVNQLQLYTEHTFAFPGHERVWGDASPMTGTQIRELDAACRAAGIELVPNFNSFGHFERFLRYPEYHHLAESPDGFTYPWGERRPHGSTLRPCEESLAFLAPLQDALLSHFTSRQFNIGCDETWELGQGWSRPQCECRGKHRVYTDFLLKLHELSTRKGHRIQFWADIILHAPELIAELPKDLIGLVWGYEAQHPFAEQCPHFAKAGLQFVVCPGTSGWNSLGGRTENMTANLVAAAREARANCASGLLITDWGDGGHHHPFTISCPGHVLGAALAWNPDAKPDEGWLKALGTTLRALEGDDRLLDPESNRAIGSAVVELGRLTDVGGVRVHNSSCMHHMLFAPTPDALRAKVTVEAHAVQRARSNLLHWRDGTDFEALPAQARAELQLSSDLMEIACDRWLHWHGSPACAPSALRGRLNATIGAFEDVWLERNRPGGLHESSARLRGVLADL